MNSPTSGSTFTFDLSPITALNNQSSVSFRIVDASANAIGGGTVGTSGTDRIDNFKVTAASVPEPSIVALGWLSGLACLLAAARRR